MRAMERQAQMAASEQYNQSLIKQIAMNTGMNASDLRSEAGLQNRQDRVGRMLNPTRETGTKHNPETPEATEFHEAEKTTRISRITQPRWNCNRTWRMKQGWR
eukprot:10528054-Heterocapsa_arctica.AAC.1